MRTSTRIASLLVALLIAACSKTPDSQGTSASNGAASSLQPLAPESADVLHAKLGSGGASAEYAAYFEGNQLARIVEQRHAGRTTVGGEYEFKGARLLHYRGAKFAGAGELDLQFDMQGRLQPGQDPDVAEDEVRAVRGRAQLLRNLALAQRATYTHR